MIEWWLDADRNLLKSIRNIVLNRRDVKLVGSSPAFAFLWRYGRFTERWKRPWYISIWIYIYIYGSWVDAGQRQSGESKIRFVDEYFMLFLILGMIRCNKKKCLFRAQMQKKLVITESTANRTIFGSAVNGPKEITQSRGERLTCDCGSNAKIFRRPATWKFDIFLASVKKTAPEIVREATMVYLSKFFTTYVKMKPGAGWWESV